MFLSYQSCTKKKIIIHTSSTTPFVSSSLFFCAGSIPLPQPPLGRETSPAFLREETSKQCLTWTLQPCQWHFPRTCTAAESLPWITSTFFPSLLGFAEANTNSTLLSASSHCSGHAMVPLWQLQPSPWHAPCLLSLPTCSGSAPQPVLLGPPNLSNKAGLRDLQRLSLHRQLNALQPSTHLGLVEEELCSVVIRNFRDKALEPWLLLLKQSFTYALNISAHLSESGVPSCALPEPCGGLCQRGLGQRLQHIHIQRAPQLSVSWKQVMQFLASSSRDFCLSLKLRSWWCCTQTPQQKDGSWQ